LGIPITHGLGNIPFILRKKYSKNHLVLAEAIAKFIIGLTH